VGLSGAALLLAAALAVPAVPQGAAAVRSADLVRKPPAPARRKRLIAPREIFPADLTQYRSEGLPQGLAGASAQQLIAWFGRPALAVWEGDARKLQFRGGACVLDVYLYPPQRRRSPVVSYVDARRGSDGREVSRAECAARLRLR